MSMVKDCANALMDGRTFEVGEGPVLGALVSMAHDELRERRAADDPTYKEQRRHVQSSVR